jgi:hypothetical protein
MRWLEGLKKQQLKGRKAATGKLRKDKETMIEKRNNRGFL